jgi:predicted alpha/beta hydrolase family esterase
MKQALILHGADASPEANWFRWIEGVLCRSGYKVWLPQLPNSATPNTKTYNDFLLSNADFGFNSETTIVGHSSGAVEILSLLQHLPDGVKVGDVYLVSAFKDNLDWDALGGLFIEPYDYSAIKEKARSITLVHSDNDPYVPQQHPRYLAEQLDARLLMLGGQGHFNLEQSDDYRSFPLLAQIIETTHLLTAPGKLFSFRGEPVVFVETQEVIDGVTCDV